ncbi:hypothetical protein H8D85_00500 [bacterium]|nr:hypothetical protein [bacterium]
MTYKTHKKHLADFEIHSNTADEFTKALPCTLTGMPLSKWASSNSGLLDASVDTVYVQLPKHRVFLRCTGIKDNLAFEEVTGLIEVPSVTHIKNYHESYLSIGSIIEVDFENITPNSFFRYKGDIDTRRIKPTAYLLVGNLVAYRGNKVTTIAYTESLELFGPIGPNIRKINDLPPVLAALEQDFRAICKTRYTNKAPLSLGTQVLCIASTACRGNRHLAY